MKKQIKLRIGQVVVLKEDRKNGFPRQYGAEVLTKPKNGCVVVMINGNRMDVPVDQIIVRPELFSTDRWNKKIIQKIIGKVVTIGWNDTDEVDTGIAFLTHQYDTFPSILTRDGRVVDIDSPSQIIKVKNAKW